MKHFAEIVYSSHDQLQVEGQGIPWSPTRGVLACQPYPTPLINRQGLLHQGWARLKKKIQAIRIGTLNVGSTTGCNREVADVMDRRKVDILCVQETRWRGNKVKDIGSGYNFLSSGADERGRNGVGIVFSKEMKENVVSVERMNKRIMKLKLCCG